VKKEFKLVHEEDVIPTIFANRQSARLITKERENSEMLSLHICWHPAPQTTPEVHYTKNDEIMYLMEGEGQLISGDKAYDWKPGAAAYIPQGHRYYIIAKKDMKILIIITPPRLRSEWAKRKDLILLEPENALKEK